MTTEGGNLEFPFPPLGLSAPPDWKRSGVCWTTLERFEGWEAECSPPAAGAPVLLLLRLSLRVEVDEDGVRTGDWLEESRDEGDAVPSLESLFFLEFLLGSLPRDS